MCDMHTSTDQTPSKPITSLGLITAVHIKSGHRGRACSSLCLSVRLCHTSNQSEQGSLRLQLTSPHTHTHIGVEACSRAYSLDSADGVDVSSCDGSHGCSQGFCERDDLSVVKWPADSLQKSVQAACKFSANLVANSV